MVCAPTGAGKTAIAEAAAQHYLSRGQRVIYTTPLKALSNQKLGEMRERFGCEISEQGGAKGEAQLVGRFVGRRAHPQSWCGAPLPSAHSASPLAPSAAAAAAAVTPLCRFDSAGLQTGDASLNIEAPVVVMTTEILRNMLYRMGGDDRDRDGISGEEGAEQGQGQGGRASSAQDRLRVRGRRCALGGWGTHWVCYRCKEGKHGVVGLYSPHTEYLDLVLACCWTSGAGAQDVGLVVLDEVHYLGDPGRGSVWEEVGLVDGFTSCCLLPAACCLPQCMLTCCELAAMLAPLPLPLPRPLHLAQVIINLPPHIQLLSMSATVRNPEDLGGWISQASGAHAVVMVQTHLATDATAMGPSQNERGIMNLYCGCLVPPPQVHGECETVRTSLRPVPLTFQYIHAVPPAAQGAQPSARLLPLLGEGGRSINPALLPPNKRYGADGEGSGGCRGVGAPAVLPGLCQETLAFALKLDPSSLTAALQTKTGAVGTA